MVANAGGVNPQACRDAVLKTGAERRDRVAGDNILDRLDDLIARGVELKNMDTGEPLASMRPARPKRQRLLRRGGDRGSAGEGAQVVVTGPHHRHRAGAGSYDARIQMEGGRVG